MKKLCKVKWVLWGLSFDDALVAQKSLDARLRAVSYITYMCHNPAPQRMQTGCSIRKGVPCKAGVRPYLTVALHTGQP